ncbi:MAG: FAD-dependent oxidoreductase [Atribacterota bacterium]
MKKRFVVIGGDAAGMSAASKARREDPDLEIVVLEKSSWASYGACGLPYYIKGDIGTLEDLVAITPDKFRKDRNIDLRLNHEVSKINPDNKNITVNRKNGETDLPYDKLLISTGARALKPNIEGIDSEGVFTLRDMESAREIKEYIENNSPQSALIIGGGYIGMEMAEALYSRVIDIHIVEMLPNVLSTFGKEIAHAVQNHLENYTKLHLGSSIQSIKISDEGKLSVQIVDKKLNNNIITDMILVATGVAPEVSLAKESGIKLGQTGAIATDGYGQTNITDIFAAGDCAEVKNVVTGKSQYIPLALAANRHGRSIGKTIAGKKTYLAPVAGTAVVKVFQLEVATTGIIDSEIASKYGFAPIKVTIDSHSRSGYYPGSKPIKISLLADQKSKKLLGASMVGEEGVAKRIDIIATALNGKFTVEELESLDLAYAPPFSPVWDPVLTAARVLNGKLE